MYTIKARLMKSSYYDLRIDKNHRSVSVAMAGRARGAISAVLDFFVTFFVKKKSKEEFSTNKILPNSPAHAGLALYLHSS
jgi:hypothetical protein